MLMTIVIICSFTGCLMIALKSRKLRYAGFILAAAASLTWVLNGFLVIKDNNVAWQFVGYTIINIIGAWSNRKDAKDDKETKGNAENTENDKAGLSIADCDKPRNCC